MARVGKATRAAGGLQLNLVGLQSGRVLAQGRPRQTARGGPQAAPQRSFFLGDGGPCRSAGYAATVRRVLATAAPDCDARTRILSFVPNIRDGRKNVRYLTDDEVRAMKSVVEDPHSELSLRDCAVVLLLVRYGLRRSDIAALRLESIDWAESAVRIVQRKTREPLELPLLPVV